jgi:hypothetical protein
MPKFKFNFNHGTRYINGPLVNLGTTRGKGSSTRMLSHCKSNSENSSDCINTVLNLEKPKPQIVENIQNNQNIQNIPENDLFNRKSLGLRWDHLTHMNIHLSILLYLICLIKRLIDGLGI